MKYFSKKFPLEPMLGQDYKFQMVEFGAEAETFEQAQKEVQDAIDRYIDSEKEKINNKLPF